MFRLSVSILPELRSAQLQQRETTKHRVVCRPVSRKPILLLNCLVRRTLPLLSRWAHLDLITAVWLACLGVYLAASLTPATVFTLILSLLHISCTHDFFRLCFLLICGGGEIVSGTAASQVFFFLSVEHRFMRMEHWCNENWQAKIELLIEKPFPVLLCLSQVPNGLY